MVKVPLLEVRVVQVPLRVSATGALAVVKSWYPLIVPVAEMLTLEPPTAT